MENVVKGLAKAAIYTVGLGAVFVVSYFAGYGMQSMINDMD